MFRSALIKMTLLYLVIIMTISIFFSGSIYQISSHEIGRGLKRQQQFFQDLEQPIGRPDMDFIRQREQQLEESNQRLLWQLFYINMGVLIIAGGVSYLLARQTLKPIEEAHEAQSRFTSDASHELRSPLAAMKSEIEVSLRDKKLTKEEAVATLRSNLEEVEKLRGLAEGLLELTRNNGSKLQQAELSLKKLMVRAIENSSNNAKGKNIKILNEVEETIMVYGNEQSLIQLVSILLENGIRYSDQDKTIRISAREHLNNIGIEIADQGFGIAEQDIPYIFDRFFQADSSRNKGAGDGYGLGLSIAKKIVDFHKGSIDVRSKIGEGSTIIVKLPKKK